MVWLLNLPNIRMTSAQILIKQLIIEHGGEHASKVKTLTKKHLFRLITNFVLRRFKEGNY
jgi:hypothetical protein